MESKEQDTYNKRLLVETLKRGKMPKRSGLGTRLYHLAGFTDHVYCVLHRDVKVLKNRYPSLTNRLRYTKWAVYGPVVWENLYSKDMEEIFEKYLVEYKISDRNGYCVNVYFNPNLQIDWGVLDTALRLKYPKNHSIDSKGFVHFKH